MLGSHRIPSNGISHNERHRLQAGVYWAANPLCGLSCPKLNYAPCLTRICVSSIYVVYFKRIWVCFRGESVFYTRLGVPITGSTQGQVLVLLPLHVSLFGDFLLTRGGTPIASVNSPRLQSLLAYLILHCDAPQARQRIAFLFWPDTTETNARNNLRQLLFELRRALPDANRFLDIEGATVQWRADAPFTLDVAEFEERLTADHGLPTEDTQSAVVRLRSAVELYRGDLLPGCYDDWIPPAREQLRDQCIDALNKLILLLEHAHDYPAAISYAQRLLRHDPLHEATYRRLMRLYALSGNRASALRTYHTCATVLQRELAVEPSAETRAEYESVLNLETPAAPSPAPLPGISPLVGRQREWAQLQSAWRDAMNGRPHLIVLQGEAGIGKTRLAEELLAWVNRQGIPNASAHCYAAESAPPFAPIVAWLRALTPPTLDDVWMAELARLLPELARAHPEWRVAPLTQEWQRQRLFEAIARALLARAQPLLLFLDDLQWCDRDTVACLRYLLRFDPQARLLIVGTCRADEIDAAHPVTTLFLALRQSAQLTEIELCPLDEPETISLAANVLGREIEAALATQVYRETEGNPLFVVEMVRALPMGARALPPRVQAAIAARLAQLAPSTRALANVAATIGRDFEFDVLASASGADEDTLVRGLDELWRRRIVREHGAAAYDFSHAKLREVICGSLSATRQRVLHRRVAEALETIHAVDLDSVSAQIAAHYDQAGKTEAAIRYYERAAQVARRLYANQEAIEHYQRALTLCQAGTPKDCVARLHENLGDVLHWIGQYDQARDAYQSALAWLNQVVARARSHRKIGNAWREQYRYPEALQSYVQAEQILGQATAAQSPEWWYEWIQVRLEVGNVDYWLGHVEQSDQLRQTLQPAIEQHGTPSQRAAFFQHLARTEMRRNRFLATPETVAFTQAAVAAYREAGNDANIPSAQFLVGFHTLWSGDPQSAMEPLETALHLAERTGDVSLQARCLTYLTVACRQRTQLDETRQYAARSLQVATSVKMPEYVGTAKANQAWAAWRAGDLNLTQELGRAALESWHQLPPSHASAQLRWLALLPLIAVALDERQLSMAVDYARALLDPTQQRLHDGLTAMLEQALRDWDAGAPESANTRFRECVKLAQEKKYL